MNLPLEATKFPDTALFLPPSSFFCIPIGAASFRRPRGRLFIVSLMALAGILGKGRFSFILASGFREVFYSLTLKISGNSDLFPRLQEYKGSGRGEGGGPLQGRSVAATTNSTRRRRRGSRGSFISDSNRVRARTTYITRPPCI